jgi:shikimate kinase
MANQGTLVLVGYRASGKSTVAKILARDLDVPMFDLDAMVEQRAGCSISELFSQQGEGVFRDLEASCLAELLTQSDPQIIATGGGAIIRAHSRNLLRQSPATVIYLRASVAVLAQRLARSKQGVRPSLTGRPIADEVAEVMAQREPWYLEVATHTISAEQALAAVVADIASLIA